MLSLIAAIGKNGVIGNKGNIPWHLPADLAHFKKTTMGHSIVMGSVTYALLGKPLPGRTNIVLSTSDRVQHPDVATARSLSEAIALAQKSPGGEEIFVIGGGKVYAEAILEADRLYITSVDGSFAGDAFFPTIDDRVWSEESRMRRDPDEKNPYAMEFIVYNRRTS